MALFRKIINYFLLLLVVLIALEIILRVSGLFRTYSEQTEGVYRSYYGEKLNSWYWTWPPNDIIHYKQPEFEYTNYTNALGLREKELDNFLTCDDTATVLFLGDSYTEGDGVQYEYSMPRFFEKKLNASSCGKYRVFNAGDCGSDPWFSYTLFRDKLLPLNPAVVILCINKSDISDMVFRGGYSRFQNDGTTLFRKEPPFERLFEYSYLFRLYTFLFRDIQSHFSGKEARTLRHQAINEIITSIVKLDSLCILRDAHLIVAIHPFPNSFSSFDLPAGDDIQKVGEGLKKLKVKIDYVDLFPLFKEVFKKNDYSNYSWKINGHFNQKGYELFAELLYTGIVDDSLYAF